MESNSPSFLAQLKEVYPAHVLNDGATGQFVDFQLHFSRSSRRPGAAYAFKLGSQHFRYANEANMLPVFEWGLNWVVTSFIAQYLSFHAAVVEKNGITLVLPAPPGSGKSTLCAILMLSGWRLLSDEHCLLDMETLELVPYVRPVAIKNNSIAVLQTMFPNVQRSRIYPDTIKGSIQYLAPTESSWRHAATRCRALMIVFPKFQSDSGFKLNQIKETDLFTRLLRNCFNYDVFGEQSFNAVCDWLNELTAVDLVYSDSDAVLRWLDSL